MWIINFWNFNWNLFFLVYKLDKDIYFDSYNVFERKRFIKLWFLYKMVDRLIQLDSIGISVESNDWDFTLSCFISVTFTYLVALRNSDI